MGEGVHVCGSPGSCARGIYMFPAVMVCLMDLIFDSFFFFNLVCLSKVICLNASDVSLMFSLHFVLKIKEP